MNVLSGIRERISNSKTVIDGVAAKVHEKNYVLKHNISERGCGELDCKTVRILAQEWAEPGPKRIWNERENYERDWRETRGSRVDYPRFASQFARTISEKKRDCFAV